MAVLEKQSFGLRGQMKASTAISAELNRHTVEMSRLIESLQEQIRNLPDNPRINRISPHAFTLSSKDLGTNWSVEFHDFKKQYELIIQMIRQASPDRAVQIIRNAAETGKIRPFSGPGGTVNLHPDVVCGLLTLIEI